MATKRRITKASVSDETMSKKKTAQSAKPAKKATPSGKTVSPKQGASQKQASASKKAPLSQPMTGNKSLKKDPRTKKAVKKTARKTGTTEARPKLSRETEEAIAARASLRHRILSEAVERSRRTVKERVEEAKFHGPEMPRAAEAPIEALPERYGGSFIVLLARDPWWLHSFWEVSPDRLGEAAAHFGDRWERTRSVLRVYDVTAVDFDGTNAHASFDIELSGNASSWYIHAGNPNRSWVVDIGRVSPENDFFVLARSNIAATPRDGMSSVLDEEWMEIDDFYEKMYALSGGLEIGRSSAELVSEMHRRLQAGGASGMVSSFGASPLMKAEKVSGFWFTLDCELIVYGATEPDATVTMQGRPVKLRPDGTFTVRMALPDGLQEIETVATSADGSEERTITPVVSRKTTSSERTVARR
ncbi:MAG: DUF4912 domain-containing protein [Verrucomicrobia bacterium]|nr:DUF4912 domain-containing protein [Verrucomicrobiota bacterium]